jgi:hypothetical protein
MGHHDLLKGSHCLKNKNDDVHLGKSILHESLVTKEEVDMEK